MEDVLSAAAGQRIVVLGALEILDAGEGVLVAEAVDGGVGELDMHGGFVAGEGQTLTVPCDGRLLTIWFSLVLDGEIWNGALPLGTGDVLTATLRLPAGGTTQIRMARLEHRTVAAFSVGALTHSAPALDLSLLVDGAAV